MRLLPARSPAKPAPSAARAWSAQSRRPSIFGHARTRPGQPTRLVSRRGPIEYLDRIQRHLALENSCTPVASAACIPMPNSCALPEPGSAAHLRAGLRRRAHPRGSAPATPTVELLFGFVVNQGDGWTYTLDALARYFDPSATEARRDYRRHCCRQNSSARVYRERARQLGQRTAEMHRALASMDDRLEFAPEPLQHDVPALTVPKAMRGAAGHVLPRSSSASCRACSRTRGPDAAQPAGQPRTGSQDLRPPSRSSDRGLAHSYPWRFSPRPGAEYGQGLRHHRF